MRQAFLIPEKVYGPQRELALHSIRSSVRREISGLNAEIIQIDVTNRGWVKLVLEGEDAEAAKNFLDHKYGSIYELDSFYPGMVLKGKLVDPTKFGHGVYVDIGLLSVKKDAFIPLYTLRKQLVNNIRKPLRKITDNFALVENFPLEIKLKNIDKATYNIEAELSESQINIFEEWIKSSLDRIIICGATRQQVRKAIIKSGHLQDILSIDRLGLLEHAVVCKYGTEAPGMISEIGEFLPKVPMKGFLPKVIKGFIETKH